MPWVRLVISKQDGALDSLQKLNRLGREFFGQLKWVASLPNAGNLFTTIALEEKRLHDVEKEKGHEECKNISWP